MAYTQVVVPLPMGPLGLNGSENTADIDPGFLVEAQNITYAQGTLAKEGGAAKYNSAAISGTPTVLGGWDWATDALAQRMVVGLSDGTLKKDSGAGTFPVTLKSGLSTSMRPYFVEGGKEVAAESRKLFIFTGINVVQVLANDAATTADLATPPADWSGGNQPVVGAIHKFRLWGAGNLNDSHRVYYSTTTDHEDFTGVGSGSISVYPGVGQKIVGLRTYKKDLLLVWKFPRGIYAIDTTDLDNPQIHVVSEVIGATSPHAILPIDKDIIFLDATAAIQSLAAVQEFGDVEPRTLSGIANMDPYLRNNLALAQLGKAQGIYYIAKREVHIGVPGKGLTNNSKRLVVDLNNPQRPRFRISDDAATALWLRLDGENIQRPIMGSTGGFVWQLDQSAYSKDGMPYLGQFRSAKTDFSYADGSLATKNKNGDFLELWYEPLGEYNFHVDILWDDEYVHTATFTMEKPGAPLGAFVLGQDRLGGIGIRKQRQRVEGSGKDFEWRVRNNGTNEGFAIAKAFLSFNVGDE